MNVDPKDDLDHAIDVALASMVEGEPRRVSAASVRAAMGERRSSRLPMWLGAAAVLIVGLAVALRARAPFERPPVGVAQSSPSPIPIAVRSTPSSDAAQGTTPPGRARAAARLAVTPTIETADEGLPRLAIASLDPLEPLSTGRLAADLIQIPRIDITPLSVSSLSTEQEHK